MGEKWIIKKKLFVFSNIYCNNEYIIKTSAAHGNQICWTRHDFWFQNCCRLFVLQTISLQQAFDVSVRKKQMIVVGNMETDALGTVRKSLPKKSSLTTTLQLLETAGDKCGLKLLRHFLGSLAIVN